MRILLIKLRHLGDTLLLTPLLRFLKETIPGVEVDVMVRSSCEAVLENNPDVNRVFAIARPEVNQRTLHVAIEENVALFLGIRRTEYDFAFDLSDSDRAKLWVFLSGAKIRGFRSGGARRSWKHLVFNRFDDAPLSSEHQVVKDFETVCRIMRIGGEPGPLRFNPLVGEESLAKRFPWLNGGRRCVVLHPTSRWSFKEWVPDRWALVADAMFEKGYQVVFSGGPDVREQEAIRRIQAFAAHPSVSIAGNVSLHEFGYILGRACLFLGVDTFAMHLAAAMQTPTVALFGPSQISAWIPWKNRAEIPPRECACDGVRCIACADPVARCLLSISVEQVMRAVENVELVRPAGAIFSDS
jgi:heptosyltransferase III